MSVRTPSCQLISIHALREEGDRAICQVSHSRKDFYPRPPRGGRLFPPTGLLSSFQFLSTPSARRATCSSKPALCFFHISIHALREEGDLIIMLISGDTAGFLSTPSARRATLEQGHSQPPG